MFYNRTGLDLMKVLTELIQ